MRLTEKRTIHPSCSVNGELENREYIHIKDKNLAEKKLFELEDIEEELGIDLLTFLKGVDPNTCFMEITKDKKFDFCGDAYHGEYTKEELLKLIQNLLFMYWALTKEKLL